MNRLRISVCAASAIGVIIALGTLEKPAVGQGNGLPAGRDVRVINTPTEPVPVTLNGTGTVKGDVNVLNTPDVKVVNSPTVKVDTTQPLRVVDAAAVAREPFQTSVELRPNFAGDRHGITTFHIPTGKRMVIEHISAWLNRRGGVFIDDGLGEALEGPTLSLPIRELLAFRGGAIDERFAANADVRFYGLGFRVVSMVDEEGGYVGRLTAAGYLIPAS